MSQRALLLEAHHLEIHKRLVKGVCGGAAAPGTARFKATFADGETGEVIYTQRSPPFAQRRSPQVIGVRVRQQDGIEHGQVCQRDTRP
jgi:hypothetical protein